MAKIIDLRRYAKERNPNTHWTDLALSEEESAEAADFHYCEMLRLLGHRGDMLKSPRKHVVFNTFSVAASTLLMAMTAAIEILGRETTVALWLSVVETVNESFKED